MSSSRRSHRTESPVARTADLVRVARLLDLDADRVMCGLAARAAEWTTIAAEQATIARMAAEAALRLQAPTRAR